MNEEYFPTGLYWEDLTVTAQKRLLQEAERTGETVDEIINRLVKEHLPLP